MREARSDYQPGSTYLLTNRMAGRSTFGEEEMAAFSEILKELNGFYLIKVKEVGFLTNTFYLRVSVPKKPASEKAARKRCCAFLKDEVVEDATIAAWQPRLTDVGWFMRDLQRRFSLWYNNSRPSPRKGSLWADRYRSISLDKI